MENITVQTRSRLTGKLNEMVLFVDQDALERWLKAPPGERRFVQDEFPHLSDDEREFLLTGSTPDEWDEAFGADQRLSNMAVIVMTGSQECPPPESTERDGSGDEMDDA